ncbi:type VI secretion system lipoprotein TssJ [Piscinibacterium candidicorallinum]|jgi:type VI secretion system protein VasD|uniref:Type VI secretion system lipoprotein TssJ n=1 Tax=Piscinibacterium candidicorallinum TaxID=1793872 RepID=A0ABV7H4R8_9BURK
MSTKQREEISMAWRPLFGALSVSVLLLALAGCGAAPKATPTKLNISVAVASNANPDTRNRPSPIVVRVYELRAPAGFEAADFFALFDKDREALAADLQARDEFTLQPGETKSIARDAKPESRHIAVFAAFRDLERATWRGTVPLVAGKPNNLRVIVEGRTISVRPAQ